MAEISKLSKQEKIFLAGCIKRIILTDGIGNTDEQEDLNQIIAKDFADFDARLVDFENKVSEHEDFLDMARSIKAKSTRDLILNVIHELSLHGAIANRSENEILADLKEVWN